MSKNPGGFKITTVIRSVVLALIVIASGAGKLRWSLQAIESMKHVGGRDFQIPILAFLEVLGGLGPLICLASRLLGRVWQSC
ncbi:MAG: DoxX family protein [Acidimicrobiaceae bacterium]|nr:DoxX family protein [Acidimicrobiaceae bacterium]